MAICKSCKKDRKISASDLCHTCYMRLYRKQGYQVPNIVCRDCKRYIKHQAKNLCGTCYNKRFKKIIIDICIKCKKIKQINCKNLCMSCYSVYARKNILCSNCRKIKSKWGATLCKSCYEKKYRERNPLKVKARARVRNLVKYNELPHQKDCICSNCNKKAEEYHHHKGYEKENWNEVIPLCIQCHKKVG